MSVSYTHLVTADETGKFQFQVGQTDLTLISEENTSPESYTGTIYLEESEAPFGFQKDDILHAVTINVPDVTYQGVTTNNIQEGTPFGTAALSYVSEGDNDLLRDVYKRQKVRSATSFVITMELKKGSRTRTSASPRMWFCAPRSFSAIIRKIPHF